MTLTTHLREACSRCEGRQLDPECSGSCLRCRGTGFVFRHTHDPASGLDRPGPLEEAEAKVRALEKELGVVLEENGRLRALMALVVRFWADTEARSEEAHAVYQLEAHRRGDVRHPDAYAELSDATKEWDRVLVRWVSTATASLLDGEPAPAPHWGLAALPGGGGR